MIIWRFLRTVLWVVGLVTVIRWGWQYTHEGSQVREKVESFRKSESLQESVKDLKTLAGEVFKGVGAKLEDDVTDEERKQLDEVLKRELMGNTVTDGKKEEAKRTVQKDNTKVKTIYIKGEKKTETQSQ